MKYHIFYMARLNAEDLEGLPYCVTTHYDKCPKLAIQILEALQWEAGRRHVSVEPLDTNASKPTP